MSEHDCILEDAIEKLVDSGKNLARRAADRTSNTVDDTAVEIAVGYVTAEHAKSLAAGAILGIANSLDGLLPSE